MPGAKERPCRRCPGAPKAAARRSSIRAWSRSSDSDDDPSLRVSLSQILESLWDLRQGVLPVDDRLDLAGLQHLFQNGKILLCLVGRQRNDLSPPPRG